MKDDIDKFRLIVPLTSKTSGGRSPKRFIAGPLLGTGMGYFFHAKKRGKVILDIDIVRQGLGNFYVQDEDEWRKIGNNIGKTITLTGKNQGKRIRIEKIGYIYENDKKAITWQFKLEKILFLDEDEERKNRDKYLKYLPGALQIMVETGRSKEFGERNTDMIVGYKALISDLKLLQEPIAKTKQKCDGKWREFREYKKKGSSKKKCFFPKGGYNSHFICEWPEIKGNELFAPENSAKLIDYKLKHYRITESLVHECIRILAAEGGWYANWEIPIKGRKGGSDRRLDFLLKKSSDKSDKWMMVEVKLDDNPLALEQIDEHYDYVIKQYPRKNDRYFYVLRDENPQKVILYHSEDSKRANKIPKDICVWTYKFYKLRRSTERNTFFGFHILDPNKEEIFST